MKWTVKQGDIITEPADVLVCSANHSLNLSGGVGADLLGRYGPKMQSALHKIVANRNPKLLEQGEVIAYSDDSIPYKAIVHAVAIDGWYDSSPEIITSTVKKALNLAANYSAKKVTLTALATGFGHLTMEQFAEGLKPLRSVEFFPVEEVCIVLLEDSQVQKLSAVFFES
jgi:O-acetyl-ADP-ribose deacetylase (regulator of RNase III)